MINFYGGQKGENYVVSQIFANTEELKKDLALDENSPVGLNEIVMISYGEYTNDGTGAYWTNLKVDNSTFTGEEDYSDIKIYNSSLYQKVPNGNLAVDDIVGEKVTYDENGQTNFVPINLYKYKFLSSSMGQIPRLILKTGEAVEAWETPLVVEDETSQIAQPIFNLSMPQAPTIIGSNGNGNITDSNGKKNTDIGILINPKAKNGDNTDINPYGVIKFDIIEQETTAKNETIQDTYKNVTKNGITYIDYDSIKSSLFGVDYENSGKLQTIKDIRGPAGLPGRIPVVANGRWYNWVVDDQDKTKLILDDSGISASFVVYDIYPEIIEGTANQSVNFGEQEFIETTVKPIINTEYGSIQLYNNQIIISNCQFQTGVDENGKSIIKEFTLAWYILNQETSAENKIITTWGWSYFVANASNFLIESGTGNKSIQQYNTGAKALGEGSVAFNSNTLASGINATAYGTETVAGEENAFVEGNGTIAASENQHVQGKYNIEDASNKYAHIVGNGSSAAARSNAYTLDWDGNSWFQGSVISRTYSIILSANDWQESQDEDNVNKYTQQIVLNDFDSHDKDWSVIVNPAYTNNMTKLELQNYQREYNRLSSGYILTETTQDKDEIIKFTVFDRPPQGDLTIMIKVV